MVHFSVGIILIIIAICLVISHLKFRSYVKSLQVIWWIPQLPVIMIKKFSVDSTAYKGFSVYYWPYPFNMQFELGWELEPKVYLSIALNFIPVIGICLTLFINHLGNRKKDSGLIKNRL